MMTLVFASLFLFLHTMSDIVVPGFKSSELIAELNKVFDGYSAEERAKLIKQVRKHFTSTLCMHTSFTNMTPIGQWCLPIRHQEL